jgi:hypothetical protein
MKTKRVEVLFDPKEYKTLEERARAEGLPVGAMVREAVATYVVRPAEQKRREAAEWFLHQEMDFDPDWDKVKEELQDARMEAIENSLEAG